jgi:hypothetical protein
MAVVPESVRKSKVTSFAGTKKRLKPALRRFLSRSWSDGNGSESTTLILKGSIMVLWSIGPRS